MLLETRQLIGAIRLILEEPDDGFKEGLLKLEEGEKLAVVIDSMNEVLNKLAPKTPKNLNETELELEGSYTALRADNSELAICLEDHQPETKEICVLDYKIGVIKATYNTNNIGEVELTEEDNSGVYDNLVVTYNDEAYDDPEKQGFWDKVCLKIKMVDDVPPLDLVSPPQIRSVDLELEHEILGKTSIRYDRDLPGNPNVQNFNYDLSNIEIKYISGVPTLSMDNFINITYDLYNAVSFHYSKTYISKIESNILDPIYIESPNEPPGTKAILSYDKDLEIKEDIYVEELELHIQGYNSKENLGPRSTHTINSRIDTISDESIRVTSGTGNFPQTFGDVYNSEKCLRTDYTTELQLLGGLFQYPRNNFSNNIPTSGPDYSNEMGINNRWVTFKIDELVENVGFHLQFYNVDGNWDNLILEEMYIFVKVEGVTGWLNANKFYDGVSNPTNDDEGVLLFSGSTPTKRRITFGKTPLTGQLYVRVGMTTDCFSKFSHVSIENKV